MTLGNAFCQEMFQVDYEFTDHNGFICKSKLYTNNKESVFAIYDTRNGEVNMSDGNIGFEYNDELSKFFYADENLSYYRFDPYGKKVVIYKDAYSEKLKWSINSQNKKTIGKYKCTEAKININGRSFTAWFSYDIPLKFGPLKLHKLPGVIFEVSEDNGFLKISLNNISKTKDLTEFQKFKSYYTSNPKIMDYTEYSKQIVEREIAGKLRVIAAYKDSNEEGNIDDSYTLGLYLDLPTQLKNELAKLHL